MSELSEWDTRQMARGLRVAALMSLGRGTEAESLPPLERPAASTALERLDRTEGTPSRDWTVVQPGATPKRNAIKFVRSRIAKGAKSRGVTNVESSGVTFVELTGTFYWIDRRKLKAVVVVDQSGKSIPARLPDDYPREGGPLGDKMRVRFDVRAVNSLSVLPSPTERR